MPLPKSVGLPFLSEAQMSSLAAAGTTLTFERGEPLIREGERVEALDLVESGSVSIVARGITVALRGPGQVFGDVAFLDGRPASASVIAEQRCVIRRMAFGQLERLLATDPTLAGAFYQSLAHTLSSRLRVATRRLARSERLLTSNARVVHSGHLSECQIPPEVRAGLDAINGELRALATAPEADDALATRAAASCDRLVDLITASGTVERTIESAANDPLSFHGFHEVRGAIGNYIARDAWPWLMRSATIARSFARPRGVAEDYETTHMLLDAEPEGDGHLGVAVDRWFLDRPTCRARRAGQAHLAAHIIEHVRQHPEARLVLMGSGTCRELFDALERVDPPVRALCVDVDSESLQQARAEAYELGVGDRLGFVCCDVNDLAADGGPEIGPCTLACAHGLAEYLTEDDLVRLLDWCWGRLLPGGEVYLSTLTDEVADEPLLRDLLQWPIHLRSRETLRGCLDASQAAGGAQLEHPGPAGFAVLRARKP